ncbi:DUF3237 domain-containing protein [Microbacterium sp. 2FI]|uniref:DUF3237 domain-containing protein n=1 Tax=Microbacterium sp. 2FI TaxID=2502193 RepID=UPI0010F8C519|nr:DUF3237 domain-containing protein [Microbacterium sp. 2FI]
MSATPVVPGLEHAFDVVVDLGPLDDYGVTRVGHRRVVPIIGGRISGGLDAEILTGGADWQVLCSDGSIEIDGRYSARTDAGELLYLQVSGVRSGPPAVLEALLRGESVEASEYYFRTTLRIETSAPRLAEYEQALFVASCVREADHVRYAAYRLT